ncbi:nucleolar zinc-finger protein [Cladochytrium tenue]|nr:nucleolar zinc-finger protein [Cladochytrium tenue]
MLRGGGVYSPRLQLIDEEVHDKVAAVIRTLRSYVADPASNHFTVILDDPAGNSYIESLLAPAPDPQIQTRHYLRSREMDEALGLAAPADSEEGAGEQPADASGAVPASQAAEQEDDEDDFKVHIFPGNCSRCNAPSDTRMHIMDIPYFKEVVIMATDCESCGYKSNEVKAGGPISTKGKRIILKVEDEEDLSRDILKSETCGFRIPEIELELTPGTLGGRFTTLEGLLRQVYDELSGVGGAGGAAGSRFAVGDSADDTRKAALSKFLKKLQSAIDIEVDGVKKGYTLILDDPLANSYLQNLYAPDDDPNMTVEWYERTFEQNEFLGLNDVVLEHYGEGEGQGETAGQEASEHKS